MNICVRSIHNPHKLLLCTALDESGSTVIHYLPLIEFLTPPCCLSLLIAVRSFSFAGSERKKAAWMGDDVRTSLSAEGLSSACLQEKKSNIVYLMIT